MEDDAERQWLIAQAETAEQVRSAHRALDRWLAAHPDDSAVAEVAQLLALTEAWLRAEGRWR